MWRKAPVHPRGPETSQDHPSLNVIQDHSNPSIREGAAYAPAVRRENRPSQLPTANSERPQRLSDNSGPAPATGAPPGFQSPPLHLLLALPGSGRGRRESEPGRARGRGPGARRSPSGSGTFTAPVGESPLNPRDSGPQSRVLPFRPLRGPRPAPPRLLRAL